MQNISTSNRVSRMALSLGLIVFVVNSTGPLGALVYLPFISAYIGITASIGWDPVTALIKAFGEHPSAKHTHAHRVELIAH